MSLCEPEMRQDYAESRIICSAMIIKGSGGPIKTDA